MTRPTAIAAACVGLAALCLIPTLPWRDIVMFLAEVAIEMGEEDPYWPWY